jgi:cyanophycinase-like exopeptidase
VLFLTAKINQGMHIASMARVSLSRCETPLAATLLLAVCLGLAPRFAGAESRSSVTRSEPTAPRRSRRRHPVRPHEYAAARELVLRGHFGVAAALQDALAARKRAAIRANQYQSRRGRIVLDNTSYWRERVYGSLAGVWEFWRAFHADRNDVANRPGQPRRGERIVILSTSRSRGEAAMRDLHLETGTVRTIASLRGEVVDDALVTSPDRYEVIITEYTASGELEWRRWDPEKRRWGRVAADGGWDDRAFGRSEAERSELVALVKEADAIIVPDDEDDTSKPFLEVFAHQRAVNRDSRHRPAGSPLGAKLRQAVMHAMVHNTATVYATGSATRYLSGNATAGPPASNPPGPDKVSRHAPGTPVAVRRGLGLLPVLLENDFFNDAGSSQRLLGAVLTFLVGGRHVLGVGLSDQAVVVFDRDLNMTVAPDSGVVTLIDPTRAAARLRESSTIDARGLRLSNLLPSETFDWLHDWLPDRPLPLSGAGDRSWQERGHRLAERLLERSERAFPAEEYALPMKGVLAMVGGGKKPPELVAAWRDRLLAFAREQGLAGDEIEVAAFVESQTDTDDRGRLKEESTEKKRQETVADYQEQLPGMRVVRVQSEGDLRPTTVGGVLAGGDQNRHLDQLLGDPPSSAVAGAPVRAGELRRSVQSDLLTRLVDLVRRGGGVLTTSAGTSTIGDAAPTGWDASGKAFEDRNHAPHSNALGLRLSAGLFSRANEDSWLLRLFDGLFSDQHTQKRGRERRFVTAVVALARGIRLLFAAPADVADPRPPGMRGAMLSLAPDEDAGVLVDRLGFTIHGHHAASDRHPELWRQVLILNPLAATFSRGERIVSLEQQRTGAVALDLPIYYGYRNLELSLLGDGESFQFVELARQAAAMKLDVAAPRNPSAVGAAP